MASQEKKIPEKKRGRPPIGEGTPVMVRLRPDQLAALDRWRAANGNPSRPEAIRRLVEKALSE